MMKRVCPVLFEHNLRRFPSPELAATVQAWKRRNRSAPANISAFVHQVASPGISSKCGMSQLSTHGKCSRNCRIVRRPGARHTVDCGWRTDGGRTAGNGKCRHDRRRPRAFAHNSVTAWNMDTSLFTLDGVVKALIVWSWRNSCQKPDFLVFSYFN